MTNIKHLVAVAAVVTSWSTAQANNVGFPNVAYTTKIGFGQKTITSETLGPSEADIAAITGLVDFGLIVAGLEAAYVQYNQSPLAKRATTSDGLELNATLRVRSPRLRLPYLVTATAYVGADATLLSRYETMSETRNEQESLQLASKNEEVVFDYTYEKIGPSYLAGIEFAVDETYGIFSEYRRGNEKWLAERALYRGEEADLSRLDENISNQEIRVGIQVSH